MSSATDWGAALRHALRLGVPPATFWQLGLAEWRALTQPGETEPLGRAALDALIKTYPDKRHD